jgi:hypothetical protein
LQKESGTIKTDLSKFNKKMSNQLKVSQDTIVIGAGTLGVGVAEKIAGFELIVAGASLANNPFTAAIGLAMMVTGETIFQFGNQNMLSGILAAATGGSGLLVFNNAKDARVDVEDTIKAANTHLKSSRKNAQQSRIVTQFVTETKNATSEITEISASASANVNSTDNVETDDKADKKLTRFNNDSIIDSKKKKKKVVAVSASSKG